MNLRSLRALALVLAFIPTFAYAQSKPVFQSGTMQPGNLAKFFTNGLIGDARGLAGDIAGKGVNPFAITDLNGLGLCSDTASTLGAYRSLCIGHDSNGNAVISVDGHGGLSNGSLLFQIGGVNQVVPGSISGIPTIADNTTLAATASTYASVVIRSDYATGNGAPPLAYRAGASACTLNAGAGDGGSQIPTSDGKCWLAAFPAWGADAATWGVLTSATSNTAALQAALTWACTNKKRVYLDAGTYQIATQVVIGNGTSVAQSTRNNCALVGIASGADLIEMNPAQSPVVLKWTGALNGTALAVNGPIAGVTLSGITVDCNALCDTGFALHYPIGSTFEHLMVTNWRGKAFVHDAYPVVPAGVLTGSQHNKFSDLRSEFPVLGTGAGGILIGPDTYVAGVGDVAQCIYENSNFAFDSTNAGGRGIELRFVDNITFVQVVTLPLGGGGLGYGLYVNPPTGHTGFPGTISFVNSAIVGGANNPAAGWSGAISFFPYPTGDGEPPPVAGAYWQYYGITDVGVPFGWRTEDTVGGNSGAAQSLTSTTTYVGSGGCNSVNAFGCSIPLTRGGHATSLSLGTSNAAGTIAGTVYVDNVPIALSCAIVSPATTCTANSVGGLAIANGARVSMRIDGDGSAPASAIVTWAMGYGY